MASPLKGKGSPDPILASVILALLGLGLITIYSSSGIYALDRYGSSTYFLVRQLMWIVLGLGAGLFFTVYDHQKLREWVRPTLMVCFVLLVAVLVFGHTVGGAKRWLRLGPVGFQPSELVKLAMVLFTAYYCDKKRSKLQDFKQGLLPFLSVLGVFCGFVFLQKDLGTPVLIFLACITVVYIAGARGSHLGMFAMVGVPLAGMAAWFSPYRRKRILSFLNPWENAQGSSYQLVQSLLAMGSGGLTGTGLGGSRSKLLYLPEPHTDFIFPILAEEFGLLGSVIVLALFAVLAWSGFRIAKTSSNLFSSLLASGITLLILYQAILNIAVVSGCLPTKGLPLPFISFGGSSLVVTLSCMGILLNISRYAVRD